jgi:hypothetical protein
MTLADWSFFLQWATIGNRARIAKHQKSNDVPAHTNRQ